jgi:malonyl-CoA decarboxylase
VAQYESVHRIRALTDLKHRLSESRRVFMFTHASMPYEPLVILHVALTANVSSSIDELIRDYSKFKNNDHDLIEEKCTNAIFYSINSCQKGLQQVDLGNAMIKSCVPLLKKEFRNLKNFHTLSPIPKFRDWLDSKIVLNDERIMRRFFNQDELEFLNQFFKLNDTEFNKLILNLQKEIRKDEFRLHSFKIDQTKTISTLNNDSAKLYLIMANFLKRSCGFYLCFEKKSGYAINSVANFHLRNGAHIFRINFAGDMSEHGWSNSYGMMVNYGYSLDNVDKNCVSYLINKEMKISESVDKLLSNFK